MRPLKLLLLALVAIVAPRAAAAQAPLPGVPRSARVATSYDAGPLANPTGEEATLSAFLVDVPGAEWLRLDLADVRLPARGLLVLTSVRDGAVQALDADGLAEWRAGSAYFNGDRVLVEVVLPPRSDAARVAVRAATAGYPSVQLASPCNPTDLRVPSSDARVARLWPVGCTAWMLDDCHHCFLTAGHCAPTAAEVVEFNVPPSTAAGIVVHPPPADQYVVDLSSVQAQALGLGADWSHFGVFANPVTGLTPFERQGAAFAVVGQTAPPFDATESLRVTGHGVDTTPPEQSRVQQTHVGAWVSSSSSVVEYRVDTTGGNSGSPVVHEPSGLPIAVHTNGGCTPVGGANSGTSLMLPALQAALAAPRGICAGVTTTAFCNGLDGALDACPCSNPGSVFSGCDVGVGSGGVALTLVAQETALANRATLQGSGYANFLSEPVVAVRAPALDPASPIVFGDGLRCISLPLVRMSTGVSIGGVSRHEIGHGRAPGRWHYQLWFRDATDGFCTPAAFNASNGLTLEW